MAVFLLNICKFDGCGITFPTLMDLIEHIESTHIDYDPKVVEQKEQAQPTCLPLSYVLRFIDATRKESPYLASSGAVDLKRKLAIKHHSYSMSSSNRSNTPTGSELDEDEMIVSESEDSNDSWTTEEFSSEFIMRYGSRHSGSGNGTAGNEKPFACPVPGCKKRYKNVNGIKYHSKNGHKKDGKVRKGYKCHCGKSYKTAQGLKSHALSAHNSSSDSINHNINNNHSNSLQNGRSSPSQSAGSLSPSSVSNLSGSSGVSYNNNLNSGNLNINSINQSQQTNVTHQLQHQQSQQQISSGTSSSATATLITSAGTNTNNSNATNNILRGNIGLISIKTTSGKPTTAGNLLTANLTANKILKLTATLAASNGNNNTSTELNNSCTIIGQQSHDNNNKLKFEITTNSNNINNNNNNQGNLDNLPLTPISPNIQQQSINKNLNNNIGSTTAILGSNGNGITLLTTSTTGSGTAVHGGVMTEKNNGDDT